MYRGLTIIINSHIFMSDLVSLHFLDTVVKFNGVVTQSKKCTRNFAKM